MGTQYYLPHHSPNPLQPLLPPNHSQNHRTTNISEQEIPAN
jgi:hypothetical protein